MPGTADCSDIKLFIMQEKTKCESNKSIKVIDYQRAASSEKAAVDKRHCNKE